MAHVSHKLSNSLEGALAGGGDPATSPLYVFGPFLKLLLVAGVAQITFGASIWLVVFTIAVVSAMYRLVMIWITDGSGGSGLSEEEFGSWAVKINAGITFIEYTLTFLVSVAALVTFVADRFPSLNETILGLQYRTILAIGLSILTGWLVNRGPKVAARAFGPATGAVLLLMWMMIFATIFQRGFQLPPLNLDAFKPHYIHLTLGGYARILAVMTGIEIFANLVAAYDGKPREKSRKAFGSLLIIMGTTSVTMLIVGPAILALSNPLDSEVSVFTQTMDQLLPQPLPWFGTLVGIAVLLSAAAASSQGLQNLALGLKQRHYVPAFIGRRNKYEVAPVPVWIEVAIVIFCYLFLGTDEETYLAIYAAGVFILLSMTGWAATKRLLRELRTGAETSSWTSLMITIVAALLTTLGTLIIFSERFLEGAWIYLIFIPILYAIFSVFRHRLGAPTPLADHIGRITAERRYLPIYVNSEEPKDAAIGRILVPLDGTDVAEESLSVVRSLSKVFDAQVTLVCVNSESTRRPLTGLKNSSRNSESADKQLYLSQKADQLRSAGTEADYEFRDGEVAKEICDIAQNEDIVVMSTNSRTGLQRLLIGSVTLEVIQNASTPLILLRPTDNWRSRGTNFKRLLVALDGSEFSERILPYVTTLAKAFGSEILLLSVPAGSTSDSYRTTIETYLQNLAVELGSHDLKVRTLVAGNVAAQTIVVTAETEMADLIMLATHGRSGMDRLMLGSVAERVVKNMPCPIFLLPIRNTVQPTDKYHSIGSWHSSDSWRNKHDGREI
ncbi:MAG: universal stress protein [Candidatus Promineifilaceae bacterium]